MRMEVRVHGSGLSDELRTIVYHETERLAQALRRRINTIKVDLCEVPGSNPSRAPCALPGRRAFR